MKKLILANSFHNTKITILSDESSPYAAWQCLGYLAYCQNDKNAKRKLKKIEKALCGMNDCKCGILR